MQQDIESAMSMCMSFVLKYFLVSRLTMEHVICNSKSPIGFNGCPGTYPTTFTSWFKSIPLNFTHR